MNPNSTTAALNRKPGGTHPPKGSPAEAQSPPDDTVDNQSSDDDDDDEDDEDEDDDGETEAPAPTPSETERALQSVQEGYPASELIKAMLRHYAIDFPKYKRNAHTSERLWQEWKIVYENILSHMDLVQKADAAYDAQWESFKKYSTAIEPFEEYLLSLEVDLGENEASPIPKPDNVTEVITFIGNWVNNRKKHIEAGQSIQSDTFTALSSGKRAIAGEINKALRLDDAKVLRDVVDKINAHALRDTDILNIESKEKFVTAVRTQVQAISVSSGKLGEEDYERMGKIVFAIMSIYIPFAAYDKDKSNAHITSEEVWAAVKAFADATLAFSTQDVPITVEDFDKQWEEYRVALLKSLTEAFSAQMISLMRQASQIRRPFFGRTVGIVRMWGVITSSSKVEADVKTAEARKAVYKLIEETQAEFASTSKAIEGLVDFADLKLRTDERKEAYERLIGKLQPYVEKYAPEKWTEVYKDYTDGGTADDSLIDRYRKFHLKKEEARTLRDSAL